MDEIDDYKRSMIEKQRVAFQACVSDAIRTVDSNYRRRVDYDRRRPIGVGLSWIDGKWVQRPWNRDELRDYAEEIRKEIFCLADDGEMAEAGIVEHENLAMMTVEATLPEQDDPNIHRIVDITVSVLGTPLELPK